MSNATDRRVFITRSALRILIDAARGRATNDEAVAGAILNAVAALLNEDQPATDDVQDEITGFENALNAYTDEQLAWALAMFYAIALSDSGFRDSVEDQYHGHLGTVDLSRKELIESLFFSSDGNTETVISLIPEENA